MIRKDDPRLNDPTFTHEVPQSYVLNKTTTLETTHAPSTLSRVLGATSGGSEGNVRAILAIIAVIAIHAMFSSLLWAVTNGSPDLKDFMISVGGLISAADIGVLSFYFGKRSAETAP